MYTAELIAFKQEYDLKFHFKNLSIDTKIAGQLANNIIREYLCKILIKYQLTMSI